MIRQRAQRQVGTATNVLLPCCRFVTFVCCWKTSLASFGILAEPGRNLLAAPPAKAANAVNSHPSGGAAPKPSWPPPDSNDPFSDLGQLPPPIRR